MKLFSRIFLIVTLLHLVTGCVHDDALVEGGGHDSGKMTFVFSPVQVMTNTRSVIESEAKLQHLWYAVADVNGDIITPFHQYKADDLSSVTIEGLRTGRYTIAFLASTDKNTDRFRVNKISKLSDKWVEQVSLTAPVDQDLLMSKAEFEVGEEQLSEQINVMLERVVGRTELNFSFVNPYSAYYIKKIEVKLDEEGDSFITADKTQGGKSVIEWFDVTRDRGFFAFPSAGKVSGIVRITSALHDGTEIVTRYPFSSHQIAAGVIDYICVNYTHPEDNLGSFHIKDTDYDSNNFNEILSDSEPKEVYYDGAQRSFRVNQPLQITINENKELQLRFYSAVGIRNVKVWVRFTKYTTEFVELATFESVKAFSEMRFKMPLADRECVFSGESGRRIIIPKMDSDSDFEFKYETEDPYIAKINKVKASYLITFHHFGGNPDAADGGPSGNWMGLRPVHAREACVALTNFAYLFSLDQFRYDVDNSQDLDGLFDNDGETLVDRTTIVDRYLRHGHFNVGLVWTGNGVVGLGGGATWGVSEGCFMRHYTNSYNVEIMIHEYGHCVGYGHSSAMTYGKFSPWVGKYYVDLIKNGELPVSDMNILNSMQNPTTYKVYTKAEQPAIADVF